MHTTSDLYKQILAEKHTVECKLVIAGITYTEAELISVETEASVFGEEAPSVGNVVSRTITVEMLAPPAEIPRQEKMELFARIVSVADPSVASEWLPKGTFFVDTRDKERLPDGTIVSIRLEGFDAMLKGEQDYTATGDWPRTDAAVLQEMCILIGVQSDWVPDRGLPISKPEEYSVREIIGYIAAMYGGSAVINDHGKLQLIRLGVS